MNDEVGRMRVGTEVGGWVRLWESWLEAGGGR